MTELMAIPIGRRPRCQRDFCDRLATHAIIVDPAEQKQWPRSRRFTAVWFLCSPHTGGHKQMAARDGWPGRSVRLEVMAELEVVAA